MVGILDPHEKYTKTGEHGLLVPFPEFMKCPGHAACFSEIFGLDTTTDNYPGTLFRFPLRKRDASSEISDTAYPPARVLKTLYDSFFEEAPLILLFLKNVQDISLYEGRELLYKVAIDPLQKQVVAAERQACKECASRPSKCILRAYSTTVQVHRRNTSENYHWLIMNLIGSQTKQSQQLGFLPWAGIAAPLPCSISIHDIETAADCAASMIAQVSRILSKHSSCIPMPWTGKVVGHNQGHVFCFLPLPGKTSLPVNVHGYFSISDNRRSIRWPSTDDLSEDAQWNKCLVESLIAPAYSVLLIIRSSLLSYSGTPLPLPSTEGGITDPYAAWPLYSEVKNSEIWIELLWPTLKQVCSERILWSAVSNGKWVTPEEALFLPQNASSGVPEVAIKVLIEANEPVVSLPREIRNTVNQLPEYSRLMAQNVVTPTIVRKTLHSSYLHSMINDIAKDRNQKLQLLVYILSDINQQTCHELEGLKLLPLATGECTSFSNSLNTESVYVLQLRESSDDILQCLPGMERHFVDPTLPSSLLKNLYFLADRGCLQLKVWDSQYFHKYLLLSLKTWTLGNSNPTIWNPGKGQHPPVSWLIHIWKYLKKFSDLKEFERLCIIPVEMLSEKCITLVPLPKKLQDSGPNGYFFHSSDQTMSTILTKLDATVIHCNQAIYSHRNISCYISNINISTVLCFLSHCPEKISKHLNDTEKSYLRREIARNYSDSVQNRQTVLRLPIFVAGVGATKACIVSLCGSDQEPILPSANVRFNNSLTYPPNILSTKDSMVVDLFHSLRLPVISDDDLFCKHLIPFALMQCNWSRKWCNGDDLFVWILTKYVTSYSFQIKECLRNTPFVRTNTDSSVLVKPFQLYKSEKQFQMLFSIERDQKFACSIYEEKGVTSKLELCGLQTWKDVKESRMKLAVLLQERARSVRSEQSMSFKSALQRSHFILEISTKHRIVETVKEVPFLFSQPTCPDSFPAGLTWFGADTRLYAFRDICFPNGSESAFLVGSVKSILRNSYSIFQLEPKFFHQPSVVDVILQLTRLVDNFQAHDNVKVTAMAGKIYKFLSNHSVIINPNDLPKNWIWWRNDKGIYSFRPASEFVIENPIPISLSPFLFDIKSDDFLNRYEQLFRSMMIQASVSDSKLVNILAKLGQISQLSYYQIQQVERILYHLHRREYQGDILMLTVNNTLKPAKQCVFDDREWVTRKATAAKSHRFTFVNDSIPAKMAQHFGVEPLSLKVAPSKKLGIKYQPAGPHETITRRIRGIVEDYSGDIDIFKELIQNADDAEATQVKFVIDWRQHAKDHLLSEELGCWQGPALLAYNNEVFSDSDFDNICKLAAETKLKDPLKTGRFGLGFCSTYYLTDVPSFVSQQHFTMFDPHTWYLKDRVSHNQPGMRINLVETQEDLPVYEHQFVPFDGIFGCNIFTLQGQGFPGTIFRFPFRPKVCASSEISKKCDFGKEIDRYVQRLKRDSSNILLFLKHVKQVEVFVLDKTASHPNDMRLLFSSTKTSDDSSASRLSMIKNHTSKPPPNCSSCVIDYSHQLGKEQTHSRHHYIVASALSPVSQTRAQDGLIPLAEIAVEVVQKDNLLIPKPIKNALLFCFLPLPLSSDLPFHVNGFFDLGKDRRNLTQAQDSAGSKWNSCLVEGAVPLALECLMAYLTSKCNLREIKSEKRYDALMQYYSLWPERRDENRRWLTDSIIASSRDLLTKSSSNILWSDISNGKWISPCKAYLFDSRSASEVKNEVITLLLQNNISVLPVSTPWAIQNQLKKELGQNRRVFTYERFFREIFLPKIRSVSADVCNKQLMFALRNYRGEKSSDYQWVKDVLMNNDCIPTQCTNKLVKPSQLIDPRRPHIASLYSPEEGRFPIESFTEDHSVMMVLREFGMVSSTLPIPELVERAKLFAAQDSCCDISDRMKALFNYLIHSEHVSLSYYPDVVREDRKERIQALWEVKFLKARSCPSEVTLPWCPVETYFSPSEVYAPHHSPLVFSHKPVFDFPDEQGSLVHCLGINNNMPDISCVLVHITKLIQFILSNQSKIDKETISYLDEVFQSIYKFLDREMFSPVYNEKVDVDAIKEKLADLKWIWQDGRLLASCQALRNWTYQSSMYLCELSQSNKSHERLFEFLGVENEATVERLIAVIEHVKLNYDEECLSDVDKEFVIGVIKELYNKCLVSPFERDVLLLDEEGVLRQVSQMTCDSNLQGEWVQNLPVFRKFLNKGGHFLHSDIPRRHGLELGARPLLDAVLKEIEDDSFLDGTDFGQEEDLVDRLNSILKKYSDDAAVFREFIQNADDAQASELVFVLDNRNDFPDQSLFKDNTQWKKLQRTSALCIFNNRPFSEKDLKGICRLGRGGKDFSAETIGRFGIGFNVAYHLTDCPMFVTYNSDGIPTDFCVLDPLRHYLPSSFSKTLPGRRWKITDEHIKQFPDQFQPFLVDKFRELQSLAPNCMKDLSKGFVVFRLPLVRKQDGDKKNMLCEGRILYDIERNLENLQSTAKENLLFLKHLRNISCFEITNDGLSLHKFSSSVEIVRSSNIGSRQIITKCVETQEKGDFCSESRSKWLLCKQDGLEANCLLLGKGISEGLKPTGGVAAMLDKQQTGRLFCYLPMFCFSGVPVHLNAHFLVDDSRKHLTEIKGLEDWNSTIATEILVPSYVEFILSAREYVTGTKESIEWFYSLFPDLTKDTTLDSLRVGTQVYQSLLNRNCAVLLDLRCVKKRLTLNWLCLTGKNVNVGYFYQHSFAVSAGIVGDLQNVLLSLGLPITCAPHYIFESLSKISHPYHATSLVTPNMVLNYLKQICLAENSNESVVKDNCEMLLKFCLEGVELNTKTLVGVPLLLSAEETLETSGSLFSHRFARLLPQCQTSFINPRLEQKDDKLSTKLVSSGVICRLSEEFVASNIHTELETVSDPIRLSSSQSATVAMLWRYFRSTSTYAPSSFLSSVISENFSDLPILPTHTGEYYPPRLGKCIFLKNVHTREDMVLSVMKKLGYAELDQVSTDISNVVSCSTHCEDVIACLSLRKPLSYSVSLSSNEVNSFILILSQSDSISDKGVLECLKKLPLYETVDGSYTSLIGKKVHIVSSDVPTAGLFQISCDTDQVVLKYPGSCIESFYRNVLKDFENAHCNAHNFYLNFLLPNFERLSDQNLYEHLKYLRGYIQDEDWQDVLSALKQTPLITTARHGRVLVSDLYDPHDPFFSMFYRSKLPPTEWCTDAWLLFLRQLGLRTKVTTEDWLKMARESAAEAKQGSINVILCQAKCTNLLETLKRMVKEFIDGGQHDYEFITFLENLSGIKFIYCPDPPELESLIEAVTSRRLTKSKYCKFTCFRESVSYKCSHLAGLSREVLPQSCQFVMQDRRVVQALCVREPLTVKAVVKNLLLLSDFLCVPNTAILTSNERIPAKISELKRLFEDHYNFLENHDLYEKCLDDLVTKRCMILFPDENSFFLVQPGQLVQHISPQYDFRPFRYGVPPELRRFGKLLSRLKVQEDLTPIHYLHILSTVKSEVEKTRTKLKYDQRYMRVCIHAFNALVVSLRQQNTFVPEIRKMKCYLPSQEYELLESNQLVYDDSPWIGSRLEKARRSYQYNFVITPPPDDSGQPTPPACLGIKSLSSLAVEKLHSDTEVRSNRCVDYDLNRCQLVKLLQETLESKDFTKGLGRLYWDEHKKNPKLSKEYRTVVGALHKCKVKCVHKITTVICVQDREVSGTEDTDKLTHFATKDDETLLYITHTLSVDLLESLSANIIKFLKHLVRNESHVKAIIDCHPRDISKVLDQREVATFDPKTVDADINDDCKIGSTFEGGLSNRDFLLICNYTPGEFVIYQSQSSSGIEFRYARVVKSDYKPCPNITERYLELHTEILDDCPVSVDASPLQVYKILDTSQMAALWDKNFNSSFVTPITLADIHEDTTSIKRWLTEILLNTPYLRNSLDLNRLCQRLVIHMHYMFVTLKSCPQLFQEGIQELKRILLQMTWSSGTDNNACIIRVQQLVDQLSGIRPVPSTSASGPQPSSRSSYSSSQSSWSPSVAPTPSQTFGMSRFSQLFRTAQNAPRNSRFVFSSQQNVASAPVEPATDLNKAKMWLHQAKADLLAAHYLCNGESHLPEHSVSPEDDDDEASDSEQEEDFATALNASGPPILDICGERPEVKDEDHDGSEGNVDAESGENLICRFPALVCFLTHDVVEKCLKGVLYAKSGLDSSLVTSNMIVQLMEKVEQSANFTQQYKQVVKECTMPVCEHIAKSRYPNYQVPPCAPAEVYTVSQATEALAAATRLVKESRRIPDVGELIGDIEVPETTLGFIATNQGECVSKIIV